MEILGNFVRTLFTKSLRKKNPELDMTKENLRNHRICDAVHYMSRYLTIFFSFFLRMATSNVEKGYVIIGLILFCLYYFSNTIARMLDGLVSAINDHDIHNFNEELADKAVYVLEVTRNQVKSRDKKHNCWYMLNNSDILSTVKTFLMNDWIMEVEFPFKIISVLIAIISAIVAIVTENTIDRRIMTILIVSTLVLGFIIRYGHIKRIRDTREIKRESFKKRESHKADLNNSASVCDIDFEYRINELRAIISDERSVGKKTIKSNTYTNVFSSFLQCIFQFVYIILFVQALGIENITAGSIAIMTGGLTIISSINGQLNSILSSIFTKISNIDEMKPYMEDFERISEVLRERKMMEKQNVDEIVFPTIEIGYEEDSENDIPFKLIANQEIRIAKGEVAILKGASGSGKSTLMKVLTGQLIQENEEGLVKADYYMYYCKDQTLGLTNNLYDELFCKREENLEKMKDILINLHLWQEFSFNCKDVWQWLKEKKYSQLSDGQKQRIICAKILYWLDDKIDLVAFDEATSGLDADDQNGEADAQSILEYLIRFCNKDKKRIVIISTHQDTEKLKSKILPEYKVKSFVFRKNGTRNEIISEN